jgi:hypothetical protein
MIAHNTILYPQQIFLKSNEATSHNNKKKSDVSFVLKHDIIIPNNVDTYIQLNSFKFINCFYNVNSSNNVLYYSYSSSPTGILDIYSYIIPPGRYSMSALITVLNVELIGYMNMVFDSNTFKITVQACTDNIMIRSGINNCNMLIGFDNENSIADNILISPNLANLSGTQMVYICMPNLGIYSNESKISSLNNVIDSVNVTTLIGTTETYMNTSGAKYKIIGTNINSLNIRLYDEFNNLLDFNDTNWYMSLSLIFAYKMTHIPAPTLNDIESTNDIILNN